jgi:hypothetical protein
VTPTSRPAASYAYEAGAGATTADAVDPPAGPVATGPNVAAGPNVADGPVTGGGAAL